MPESLFPRSEKVSAVAESSNATVGKVSGAAKSPNEYIGLFSAEVEYLREISLFWEFDGKGLYLS